MASVPAKVGLMIAFTAFSPWVESFFGILFTLDEVTLKRLATDHRALFWLLVFSSKNAAALSDSLTNVS